MIDQLAQLVDAASWLVPELDSPWQWSPDCEAVVWRDGSTVVFREELAQILERLPGRVLPRAGSLMLLLAASRGKAVHADEVPPRLSAAVNVLEGIAELDPRILAGVPARALLAEVVFEKIERTSGIAAATVIWALRSGLDFTEVLEIEAGDKDELARDLAPLCNPLIELDAATLERIKRTGVPAAPEPAPELELPLETRIGNLFQELLTDPELAGIARVARQIMAAVSLPEALSRAEDETLGGVSDIGNRGPLHRLLLSELAHDDETLAVRLALNEALFLRREPAANHPPSRLVLLVDAGVRMWGLPRLFAAAAALAFLAKARKRAEPLVYRSAEGDAISAPIWSKAGLADHLAALDSHLDSRKALAALTAQLAKEKAHVDLVVITHRATLESPVFLELLPAGGGITVYAAGVDRAGHVTLHTRTAHSLRRTNEVWIDPAALFGADPRRAPRLRDADSLLPAALRAEPFPFLLPPESPVELGWSMGEGGGICLTRDGALWHWSEQGQGGRQLPLPRLRGRTLGLVQALAENCWIAVKYRAAEQRLEIARWFAERGDGADAVGFTQIEGVRGVPGDVFAAGGYLYVVLADQAVVVSISTGREAGRGKFPPKATPAGTRFLAWPDRRFAIFYWDGTALRHVHQDAPALQRSAPVLIFDRGGHLAPWAVGQDGHIFDVTDPSTLGRRYTVEHVLEAKASPNGESVWLRLASAARLLVSLPTGGLTRTDRSSPERSFEGYAEPQRWGVRSKFTHIGVSPAGGIMLRAQKGYHVEITYLPEGRFILARHEGDPGVLRQVPFGQPDAIPEAGCSVRRAEWSGGSRAWLDPRGLLHLQSHDARIPEVSLVLASSGAVPVWASDGRKIGPSYFLGDHRWTHADAEAIGNHLQRFGAALL